MTYLDHAATTPMLPEAAAVMSEAFARVGNASSLHTSGRRARRLVEESREEIASALGARPSEVVFTGGGTESDNLAIKGIFWGRRAADPRRNRVLASAVEHHAVLDAVQWLADHEGAEIIWLEADSLGRVRPEALEAALHDDPDGVALASVMWANNEVGTVNPVAELAGVAERYGVPLHTDAVQAVGAVPVDFAASGASALTLTGHKVGGPYGSGVLLLGRDVPCTPVLHGGGQERDVRSGTLDTPGVHGLATAVHHAVANRPERAERLARLSSELVHGVLERVPDAVLNGEPDTNSELDPNGESGTHGESRMPEGSTTTAAAGTAARLPGNVHFTFPGCEGDSLLMLLDAKGIECSTGSACTAGVAQPSHVLLAMGASPEAARGSLRFSLGHTSGEQDVRALLDAIGPVVERARNAGLTSARGADAADVRAAGAAPEV